MPDTNWTHETAGEVTTTTSATSSPATAWTNENVGDGEITTITSTSSGLITQEIVGSSGIATTTSSPTTTWVTETIGNHIAGSSLTVDSIKIDDNNIGHTSDVDLLTFAPNLLLILGQTNIHPDFSLLTDTIKGITTGAAAINLDDAPNVEILGDLAITGNNITTDVICNQTLTSIGMFTAANRATFQGSGAINFQSSTYISANNTTDASDNLGDSGAIRCKGGVSIAKKLYVGSHFDVDGMTTLDNTLLHGTLTVGLDDNGNDVKFYGETSGNYMLWDQSQDCLELSLDTTLFFHDQGDEYIKSTGNGQLRINSGSLIHSYAAVWEFNGNVICNDNLTVGASGGGTGELFQAYGDSSGAFFSYNNTPIGRNDDVDLIGGDMRIKKANTLQLLELNTTLPAGPVSGPNIDLIRGDYAVGQEGIAGKLGEITFKGMADDGTLAREPFGRILCASMSPIKDLERGAIYIDGNVDGALANIIKGVPYYDAHSDGNGKLHDETVHIDINIGHENTARITMNGIVKCAGNIIQDGADPPNDIIRMNGISDEGEIEEAEILNLRVTHKCKGNFLFENTDASDTQEVEIGGTTGSYFSMTSNDAVFRMPGADAAIRMSGANPVINLTGSKPEIKIGDTNEAGGNGYLELGYASGTDADAKPGIINLKQRNGNPLISGGGGAYLWVDGHGKLRINSFSPSGTDYNDVGTIVGTQTA